MFRIEPEPGASERHPGRRLLTTLGCLALLSIIGCARDLPQSTVDPVTDFGHAINDLYGTIFWWTMLILAVVWAVLAYVLIRYRHRPGGPEPKRTRGNLALEVGWTMGPAIIVVLIAIPSVRLNFETQAGSVDEALVVDVIGHQWWWEFRYPEQGVVTANELYLPVGRPIELRLRSADVIHDFWVPRLGGKRDLNPTVRRPEGAEHPPNRLHFTIEEPGDYIGQCAEFCGTSHALMRMKVVAEAPEGFEAWVGRMSVPPAVDSGTVAERGREIFMRSTCIACHAIQGTPAQGQIGPNLTRFGARETLGARVLPNTKENLIRWITDPGAVKPGALMPGTREAGGGMPPTGLSDEEVEAVAEFLLSLE